ncbi:MAG: hypothetical protein QOI12_3690 [Alphaproteobacteria bacterium]|jgi:uncharacterized membrane protein|nr:hypothetical protein [Alphaproteobacteria bacterium]
MPWFYLQRAIEMLLAIVLYDTFSTCQSLGAALAVLERMDHLQQIGVVTAAIVAAAASVGIAVRTWEVTREVLKGVGSWFERLRTPRDNHDA